MSVDSVVTVPTEPARRTSFRTAFRGFDQTEVRAYLVVVHAALDAARSHDPDRPDADLVGEEVARILAAATVAAERIRARAEDDAGRIRHEAEDVADTLRADAAAEVASQRAHAVDEVTELRRAAAAELDELRARRDEIAVAIERARQALDGDAVRPDRAPRRIAVELLPMADEAPEPPPEVDPAPEVGPDPLRAPDAEPPPEVDPAPSREPASSPAPEVASLPDLDLASVPASEVASSTSEVASLPEMDPDPVRTPEGEPPPEVAPAPLPGPEVDPLPTMDPDPDVEPRPQASVGDLFSRMRADREAAVADARAVLARDADAVTDAPASDEHQTDGDEPEPHELDDGSDAALLRRRAARLGPVASNLAVSLKRALADEQNAALDELRRSGDDPGEVTLERLVGAPDVHAARYRDVAFDALGRAFDAGREVVDPTVERGLVDRDDVVALVDAELVVPLRDRLERAVRSSAGDRDEVSARLRAAYREWKVARLEPVAAELVLTAHGRGTTSALEPGRRVRWIVDPAGPACPDADDNALAGGVPYGEAFPTGHIGAPAHAGCRCALVPAG